MLSPVLLYLFPPVLAHLVMRRSLINSQCFQLFLSCLLSLPIGAVFAVNVFTIPVELASQSALNLVGVWPRAITLTFFLGTFSLAGFASFLQSVPSQQDALRGLVRISAGFFVLFSIAGVGVKLAYPILMQIGVMCMAIPFSALTTFRIEHCKMWMPRRAGLAVAMTTMSASLGIVSFSSLYSSIIAKFSVTGSIFLTSTLVFMFLGALSFLVRVPSERSPPETMILLHSAESNGLYSSDFTGEQMLGTTTLQNVCQKEKSMKAEVRYPTFWMYVFIVFSLGASFPAFSYFFELGDAFSLPQSKLVACFQLGTTLSMFSNFLASAAADFLRLPSIPHLSHGARNVVFIMFTFQFAAYTTLSLLPPRTFGVWLACVTVTRLVFQATVAMTALLAHDLFGATKGALVFGMGGGLAIGFGQLSASALYEALSVTISADGRRRPEDSIGYYSAAAVWSAAGALMVVFVRQK